MTYTHIEPKYRTRNPNQRSSLLEPSQTWIQVRREIESLVRYSITTRYDEIRSQVENAFSQQPLHDYWRYSIQ